jgi:hypothetical protein
LLFGVALIYIAFYVTVFTLDPNGEIYYWFGDGWLGPTAVAIIPAILFFLSIAGFAYRRKSCRIPDLFLLSGLSAISILAEHLVSNDYVLLLAAAELVILLGVLASSPLSSAAKWRLAFVCVGVIAAPLIFGRTAVDQFSNPFVADEARSILDGALFVGPSPVYLAYPKALASLSEATVLAAGISAYGWLFGIGVIGLFGVLLTLMVRRSLRIAHPFGRFLSLGICVWFGIQFILLLLINLGFVGSVPVFLPFVSSDASFHLTDAALIGVFLSVWRRSSFMRGQDDTVALAVCQ